MESRPAGKVTELTVTNEFARVTLRVETLDGRERLTLLDHRTGREACICPLILQSLVLADDDRFNALLDPSETGWRDEDGSPRGERRHLP